MSNYSPVDIANPKSYKDLDKIDELFTRLRKEDPILWVEPEGFQPFWAITKFADIVEIESKPNIFKSNPQPILQPKVSEEERMKKYGRPSVVRSLNHMDPPDHSVYRSIAQGWLSPENLQKFQNTVRANAKIFVDKMVSYNGECDFASEIARKYPLRNIMMFLGLPQKDEEKFLRMAERVFFPTDPNVIGDSDRNSDVQGLAQLEMMDYFRAEVQDRRATPRDDILSLAANMKIDGKPIPDLELLSILTTFGTAGHDTTAGTIAGSMLVLAQHPDILKQIKNNLALIPSAVEEMIRWVCPGIQAARTAAADYEIRGRKIKAGQRVVLFHRSGCRDEEFIEDPFTIRIDRKPNRHVAFGSGSHVCLGQHFSRLETIILFEELIPRLESVQLNGEIVHSQGLQVSRILNLPIRYVIK